MSEDDVTLCERCAQGRPLPSHLTARQVGEMFSLSARSITGMALRGEIPAHRIGGAWRFNPEELREWYPTTANR